MNWHLITGITQTGTKYTHYTMLQFFLIYKIYTYGEAGYEIQAISHIVHKNINNLSWIGG